MAKERSADSLWSELFSPRLYKRNQGRLTRQLTAVGICLVAFFGAWTLSQAVLSGYQPPVRVGIPLLLCVAGAWFAYRVVNFPKFADFLVAVEAEMDKVTWVGRQELIRQAIVVVVVMFLLAFILLAYDVLWQKFFQWVGFLQLTSG